MPESPDAAITLYYAPRTRSFTALWLLEEMGLPYRLEAFDLATGRHKQADFRDKNPMGKVPVVVEDGTPVSEIGAIALWLTERHPEADLAPALGDPRRAEYLRWIVFAAGVMEPAYAEKFGKWEPRPRQHAWGSFDQMLEVVEAAVRPGPYLLGQRFTAADVVVGSALRFGLLFGILAKDGPIPEYVARLTARDGYRRAEAIAAAQDERFPMPAR